MAIIGKANGENERLERVDVEIPYSNTNVSILTKLTTTEDQNNQIIGQFSLDQDITVTAKI
ncbi:hypothetical protein A2U01_0068931, partial [Trifolium medium]|nr:hypothetical protein [Trifolium medium]